MASEQELIQAAWNTRENACAEYSHFKVGAAVEADDGAFFTGCNVENATYGLTVCAERVAIWKALSEGRRKFVRMIIAADTAALTPPCGACRQILWEYCGDIPIVLVNRAGGREEFRMRDLFPRAFDRSSISE